MRASGSIRGSEARPSDGFKTINRKEQELQERIKQVQSQFDKLDPKSNRGSEF